MMVVARTALDFHGKRVIGDGAHRKLLRQAAVLLELLVLLDPCLLLFLGQHCRASFVRTGDLDELGCAVARDLKVIAVALDAGQVRLTASGSACRLLIPLRRVFVIVVCCVYVCRREQPARIHTRVAEAHAPACTTGGTCTLGSSRPSVALHDASSASLAAADAEGCASAFQFGSVSAYSCLMRRNSGTSAGGYSSVGVRAKVSFQNATVWSLRSRYLDEKATWSSEESLASSAVSKTA